MTQAEYEAIGRVDELLAQHTGEQQLWSVTTILSEGVPKPQLISWGCKVTALRAVEQHAILRAYLDGGDPNGAVKWLTGARWETQASAAGRGTAVHEIIEAYALGKKPDVPAEFEPWHRQIRRFLDDHQPEYEMSEAPVYNLEYGYAGTLDAILRVQGARCVVDMKTTDKGPDASSRPPYPDVALQLCAYSRAQLVGVGAATMRYSGKRRYYLFDPVNGQYEEMPPVDGALVLVVSPEDYTLTPARIDDTVWDAFLTAREMARWKLQTERAVLGPPITPGGSA